MKFSIEAKPFAEAVAACAAVAERKTTIPILGSVLIRAGERVELIGTDLEVGLRLRLDAEVKQPGAVCIPAALLARQSRSAGDGTVEMALNGTRVAMKAKGFRCSMVFEPEDSFPALPDRPAGFYVPGDALRRALRRTLFAVAKEDNRFTLKAVLLTTDARLTLVATDGHCLSEATEDVDVLAIPKLLIPSGFAGRLANLAGETITLSHDENHIYAESDDALLTGRRISGTFPDYQRILPTEHAHSGHVQRRELLDLLAAVAPFAAMEKNTPAIRFAVKPKEIEVSAAKGQLGEFSGTAPGEFSGSVEYGMDPDLLSEALRAVDEDKVELLMNDSSHALELRVPGFRCLVMPKRLP